MLKIVIPFIVAILVLCVSNACVAITLRKRDIIMSQAMSLIKELNENCITALKIIDTLKEKDDKRDIAYSELFKEYYKASSIANYFTGNNKKW